MQVGEALTLTLALALALALALTLTLTLTLNTSRGGTACSSAKLRGASAPPQKGCSSSSRAKGTWPG